MKTKFTLLIFLFMVSLGVSQTDGISYQAVIIDNNPQEIPGVDIPSNNLPNVPLTVRFSIIDSANAVEYQETQNTTTDPYGMINLMIGHGNAAVGAFNQIYWDNTKYLKVEIDLHNGDGMVEFSYQELTYIPYVRHREIIATSTLDVDGVTNLNNNLTVNNAAPTHLTGDLTVDGLVSFDGELSVGGDTQLYSDLTVDGVTNLNNSLFVNNGAPTLLSGNLNVLGQSDFQDGYFQNITVAQNSHLNLLQVDGNATMSSNLTVQGNTAMNNTLTVNSTTALNGRTVIEANLTGGQSSSSSYPLEVRGASQGIWIDVAGGRNSTKNFLTFSDAYGEWGAVEGQTLSELSNSFRYIWDAANALAEEAFIAAEGVACASQLDAAEAILMGVQTAVAYARLLELVINAENNVGVSFKTGGADYAEWLPKLYPQEEFYPGEIVGVVGGKIQKNTAGVDHIMVISTNPIVLGNDSGAGKMTNHEKVAFLGQVPVRVIGKVNVGDYILPSGNNDGTGIAKSVNEMQVEDYKSIVGVAWEASVDNSRANAINVAIGINANDLSAKVIEHDNEIKELKAQLDLILKKINGEEESAQETQLVQANPNSELQENEIQPSYKSLKEYTPKVQFSKVDFDNWLNKYGYIIEEKMAPLRSHFEELGVDLSTYPEIQRLVEKPLEVLKDMQSGKYLPNIWKTLEKQYPNAFKKN